MTATTPSPTRAPAVGPPDIASHLRSPVLRHALAVQRTALRAVRDYLGTIGIIEVLPTVVGPVTDPGTRGSKQVDIDWYGHRYKLMTSGILYKQASLLMADAIFHVAPNVRLEPPETSLTRRHLAEFHQIDVEVAGASRDEVMTVARDLLRAVLRRALDENGDELAALGRDTDSLRRVVNEDFDVRSHDAAVAALRDLGYPQSSDAEIEWAGEELLSQRARRPFFVIDYPKGCRGFYDRESRTEVGRLRNFDLVAPDGFGELVSGSERENDYARLVTRMRETGENPAKYRWYLDLVREGIPASAGFGMGLERLVRFLTGLDELWQVTAFPKIPGRVSP